MIAVNSGDPRNTILKYAKEGGFTFTIGMDNAGGKEYGVVKKYGVSAFPTNYLLDSTGKVIWRSVGFDENGLRDALARLGVK